MNVLRVGLVILLGLCINILAYRPAGAPAPATVLPNQEIPRDFDSWSLFLVCNNQWFLESKAQDLEDLRAQFLAFGKAIGARNVATWFLESDTNLDVNRNVAYCGKYGLAPSESPYVVVTTKYPGLSDPIGDRAVLKLNGLSADEITTLLGKLGDKIVLGGLQQETMDSERYWTTFKDGFIDVARSIGGWIKSVKLTIDTKVLKLEVEGGG